MRIFISSPISGMGPFRDAADGAARTLGHEVARAENFAATDSTPQRACLAEVRGSDALVLILGASYGAPQASGLSATHEEYREARERCPVLVFVQEGVDRDSKQAALVQEVQDWSSGHYTAPFRDPDSLRDAVTRGLHEIELAGATGPVDADDLLERALALVPEVPGWTEVRLFLALTAAPRQTVLRPAELDAPALAEDLKQMALFGENRVLDVRSGTEAAVHGHVLAVTQAHATISLSEEGSISIDVPLYEDEGRTGGLMVILEEQVNLRARAALRYAAAVLERVDPLHRLTHFAPVATVLGADHLGWRRRAEHAASPNEIPMRMAGRPAPVHLSPPHRPRATILHKTGELAEDLTVLIRRARTD